MNIEEFPESDSSDEDYVPDDGKNGEVLSEVDSDGDSEPDALTDNEDESIKRKFSNKKRTGDKSVGSKRKKLKKSAVEEKSQINKQENGTVEENSSDKKKTADDLWADFMKDTGFRSKNSKLNEQTNFTSTTTKKVETGSERVDKEKIQSQPQKVKVSEVMEFAGEKVIVEKEIQSDSIEAQRLNKLPGKSKKSGSGISNILSQLGKKQKLSTLEKSQLDWNKFKKEENIEEELQIYNKGKDGYLDKQDFLQRADLRRFEIEKDIRNVERAKRFNNTK